VGRPSTGHGSGLIIQAITLATAVADGANDEEITPGEIALIIHQAIESPDLVGRRSALAYLQEALEAVSDGKPPDHTVMILQGALKELGAA
jgi:hypothetical protein